MLLFLHQNIRVRVRSLLGLQIGSSMANLNTFSSLLLIYFTYEFNLSVHSCNDILKHFSVRVRVRVRVRGRFEIVSVSEGL